MKIKKYKKLSDNRYQVTIDDEVVTLYDDIIIKYNLISKSELTNQELKEIIKANEEIKGYYLAIKYINIRLRTNVEVKKYLQKKEIDSESISLVLNKLADEGYFNQNLYLQSYINDQINLTNNGPYKILRDLNRLGFNDDQVYKYLDLNASCWQEKISKLIEKKLNINKNKSKYVLFQKIINDILILGYDKELVVDILQTKEYSDIDAFSVQAKKVYKQLEKKYNNDQLDYHFRQKMFGLGYETELINDYLVNKK